MDLLKKVKYRLGVWYSDPLNDEMLQGQIDSAKIFLRNAGFPDAQLETSLGVDAIVLYIKQFDKDDATLNPLMVSIIAQARATI